MLLSRFPFYQQYDAMDCGPSCVRMISKYYGKKADFSNLIENSFYTRKGVSLKGISYSAETIGFKTVGLCTSYEKLLQQNPTPFIIHWNQEHFLVVYKIRKNFVEVADPALGKYKISKEDFLLKWATTIENGISKGICLLLQPLPEFYNNLNNNKKKTKTGLSYLFSFIRPYRKLMYQLLFGLIAGTILQLIFPFIMQNLVDVGVKRQNISFITLLLIAQFVLILSSSFVEIIRSWILLHISTRINISLVSDFLIKLMKLPISYFDTKMTGDIKQRIDDHTRIESFLTGNTLSILFSFLNLIVFSIVLGFYSLKILLIFYLGAILYIFWVSLFLKKRKRLDILRFGQSSVNQNTLYRLITQMQEIKLHNAEHQKRWEWENLQAKVFRLNIKTLTVSQFQISGGLFLISLLSMCITFFSATSVIEGSITLGMMISVQYIIGQLSGPLNDFIDFLNSYQDAKLSLDRLSEIHLKSDENANFLSNSINITEKTIAIKNLSFSYEGPYSPKVLEEINLVIPENKVTAIVGVSGSGKTTLMKLLIGFYKPQVGAILIGENNLNNYNTTLWRNYIGAVMQDGVIFSDTIAENIAIGNEIIDKERLKESAQLANIHDFVMSLPLKYNTKIGEDGSGLSQGQKQRLLIARAIYKNPSFLFLDEATNALDTKSEKVIVDNLNQFFKNKTVLVIAHRLSTVKNADNIVVIDKGRIVEQGKHHELVKLKGFYFQLIQNQLELGA